MLVNDYCEVTLRGERGSRVPVLVKYFFTIVIHLLKYFSGGSLSGGLLFMTSALIVGWMYVFRQ